MHPTAPAPPHTSGGSGGGADGKPADCGRRPPCENGEGGAGTEREGGGEGSVVTTATAGAILWRFTLTGPYVDGERKRCPDGSSMY